MPFVKRRFRDEHLLRGIDRHYFHQLSRQQLEMFARIVLSALGVLFIWHSSSLGESPNELLDRARAQNRRSVEAIHSLYCRFKAEEIWPEKRSLVYQGECWLSGQSMRINWKMGEDSGQTVLFGGHILRRINSVDAYGRRHVAGIISNDSGLSIGQFDPRYDSLMFIGGFRNGSHALVCFDEAVATQKLLNAQSYADKVVLECRFSEDGAGKAVYQFDPNANYTMTRFESSGTKGNKDLRGSALVDRLGEPAPGIFFPLHVSTTVFKNEKIFFTKTVEFTEITINRPPSPDVFQLRFERGTMVDDQITGMRYEADENGRSIGKETKLGLPPPSMSSDPGTTSATQDRPLSWTRWMLRGSIACLIISIVAFAMRRWRARRDVT
jgi:hypothetical protein